MGSGSGGGEEGELGAGQGDGEERRGGGEQEGCFGFEEVAGDVHSRVRFVCRDCLLILDI